MKNDTTSNGFVKRAKVGIGMVIERWWRVDVGSALAAATTSAARRTPMLLTIELRNLSAHDLDVLRQNTRQPGTKIAVQAVLEDLESFDDQACLHAGAGFVRILNEDTTQRMSLRSCPALNSESSLGPDSSSGSSGSSSGRPQPPVPLIRASSIKDVHGVPMRMRQPPPPKADDIQSTCGGRLL